MDQSQGLSSLEPRGKHEPLNADEEHDGMGPNTRATRMFPGKEAEKSIQGK